MEMRSASDAGKVAARSWLVWICVVHGRRGEEERADGGGLVGGDGWRLREGVKWRR
jgi:hypothetical protein